MGKRYSQDTLGTFRAIVSTYGGESLSGVVIDCDEPIVMPHASRASGRVAPEPVAHTGETPQVLDINVQRITSGLAPVAVHGFNRSRSMSLDSPAERKTRLTVALGG